LADGDVTSVQNIFVTLNTNRVDEADVDIASFIHIFTHGLAPHGWWSFLDLEGRGSGVTAFVAEFLNDMGD
jgi:hypothetical protein